MKKPNFDRLYEIADGQQGFFTAHQATECGFSRQLQVYYLKKGEWIRHARSIFKLASYSNASVYPDNYYITQLWSENQQGQYEGVMGYTTALFVHGLLDEPPQEIHFIVPKRFRRNSPPPGKIRFHRRDLEPEQIDVIHGLKVTGIAPTLRDVLLRGILEESAILKLIRIEFEKKRITQEQLEQLAADVRQRHAFAVALSSLLEDLK